MTERGGALSFGDVTGEYLALRDEAAWVTPWHDLVWVRGPDAVGFLDGLVSQAIEPMRPGATQRSLLLGPRGKLRAPHLVLRGDGEIGLLSDAGSGETVAGDLARFKIRVDLVIERESGPLVTVVGPRAVDAVAAVTGDRPRPSGWTRSGAAVTVAVPFPHTDLPRIVVVGADPDDFAQVRRAGRLALDAIRIEQGEPFMGVDIDDRTIPHEAGLVGDAVDFTKGCYLGQELVARIDSRGHVNRHLRGVRLTTNVVPPEGAEVVAAGDVVGVVSSVAESLDLRAPVGLALLRREVAPGDAVTLRWKGGTAPAVVSGLPMVGQRA